MNGIVHALYNIVQCILGPGPTIMLPLVLFILTPFFEVRPARALRSSLTVGIGLVGTYAIFDILASNIGPAAWAMVGHIGINLPVVGLDWPSLPAITWGLPIAPFVIPLTILVNVAMLVLNKTHTVNIDTWDYWYFALAGTLVYYSTGGLPFGLLAVAIVAVVILRLADWPVSLVQKYSGLKGISLPAFSSVVLFPVDLLVSKIIDHIPGLDRIRIDPEAVQRRFGISGESTVAGTILGILLGVIAGYNFREVLLFGVGIGGVMFISPRMVHTLMEGLLPLFEAARKYLSAKYPNRSDLYVDLDTVITIGNPTIISTALLPTPISVSIVFVLPGNEVLPLGDLANLAVMASMTVLVNRGNVFRTVLAAIPVIIVDLWIATKIASPITGMARDVNFRFTEGSNGQVFSFLDDGSPFHFWLLEIFDGNLIAIGLAPVIALTPYSIF